MVSENETQSRLTAVNACRACWSKKRKCDRLLPECSRCIAVGTKCAYWDVSNSTLLDQAMQPSTYTSGRPNNNGIPLLSRVDPLKVQALATSPERDARVTVEVCSLLRELDIDIGAIIDQYGASIHHWLPLFEPQFFNTYVTNLDSRPCADTALLLVHILLISWSGASPTIDDPGHRNTLYRMCKSIFPHVRQTTARRQMATIKAGILLAAFEIGNRSLSDAFQTLETCASVWRKTNVHARSVNDAASIGAKEMQTSWWAINMLDRILCLFSGVQRVSIVAEAGVGHGCTTQNHLDRAMPYHKIIQQQGSEKLDAQYHGFTADQIQALGLLDDLVSNRILSSVERRSMDSLLQQRLSDILERKHLHWVLQYSTVVIFLLALVELQGRILLTPDVLDATLREQSQLALKTALQMTGDVTLTDDINRLESMPLIAVLLLKKAVAVSAVLGSGYQPNKRVLADIHASLQRARARWEVANDTVKIVWFAQRLPDSAPLCARLG